MAANRAPTPHWLKSRPNKFATLQNELKRGVACFTTYVQNCLETLKSSCCKLRWSPYLGFESCSRRTFSGRDSRPLVLLLVIAELKVLLAVFKRRRSCSARR